MLPHRRPAGRTALAGSVFALAVVGLLLLGSAPVRAGSLSTPSSARPQAGGGYIVTWNGVDVSTASSSSSAISIDFTQTASLAFNWTVAGVTIKDARLQMFYFGFAVSTRDQIVNNPVPCAGAVAQPCNIPLSWTPLSIDYVLEGVYRLTASFIAPNGTTMFSENFYVRGNALYGVVAIIPIVLLLIAIYEVYALVRSGRYALLGRKPSTPPPSTPPASPPSAEPPASAEGPEEEAPPSGGTSP